MATLHQAGDSSDTLTIDFGTTEYSYAGLNAYAYLTTSVVLGGAGWTITSGGLDDSGDVADATLGSELLGDPSFDTGTGWEINTASSEGDTWSIAGGKATSAGTGLNNLQRPVGITVGKLYSIIISVSDYTSGTTFVISNGGFTDVSTTIPSALGVYGFALPAINTDDFRIIVSGWIGSLSDVSTKEVLIGGTVGAWE